MVYFILLVWLAGELLTFEQGLLVESIIVDRNQSPIIFTVRIAMFYIELSSE